MKHISYVFFTALVLASCSPLQKALKVDDTAYKNEVADQLYEKGKYKQAIRLYEQIEKKEGWTSNFQSMYYKYSKAYYNSRKWEASKPMFQKFNLLYLSSPNREETMFLEAMSAYEMSEVFTLDQHVTYEGIQKFDTFLTAYPDSQYKDQALKNSKELKEKIERKAFESAKLYNKIGEYTRDYNAAIVALDNFLLDYPGTVYKTDALYYKYDSAYKLALNSVYSKMEERLKKAIDYHDDLVSYEPNTKYKEEADKMLERLKKELQQFATK
ncbi:outer membrane protein assembly factor BamD [Flavobacterium sp. xlx-214]|uniref:outer membrane protein assembly factor BamD n=1 Tax=unclassified Flavobacterium TaxID=196869 RepID=UPI0013D70230|nr:MULTISPECIES: outer membrane protein assembly factor BamD [unclassified Flavobacterium]MBA5793775.1 outer membrane protein assembly factor BamD [Flavobacterium sp. xlx-221]QMI83204.1 outer membrane protein assembly factor BamD [Flavobacterium sp. xlx-214]